MNRRSVVAVTGMSPEERQIVLDRVRRLHEEAGAFVDWIRDADPPLTLGQALVLSNMAFALTQEAEAATAAMEPAA
jgi:hypothetical protein